MLCSKRLTRAGCHELARNATAKHLRDARCTRAVCRRVRVTPVGGSTDALQAVVADAPKHACLLVGHDKHVCVVLGLSLPASYKKPV